MAGTAGEAAQGVLEAVVRQYWPDYSGTPEAGAAGWNNTTRFVRHGGRKYVLRVYETHRDVDKIRFEHEVLLRLAGEGLTFRTPVPRKTSDGETIVRLADGSGRYACVFEHIEGVTPGDDDRRPLRSFGEAAGELSGALACVRTELPPAYRPYYELEQAYPLCGARETAGFCAQPPAELAGVGAELGRLAEEYAGLLRELGNLRKLPHQLVHGDLNASNLLVEAGAPERIAALLDFEFCTYDVRAMDAAVILSGLPAACEQAPSFEGGPGDAESAAYEAAENADPVLAFGAGFGRSVRLEPAEIEAIPLLMRLRKVDVFLHFLTRYLQGTDGPDVLAEQARVLSRDLDRMVGEEAGLLRRLKRVWS